MRMSTSTSTTDDAGRYREHLREELDGAYLYRVLADVEESPQLAELYRRLAAAEERHAGFWRERLGELGDDGTPDGPSRRARILGWLARRYGPALVLPTVIADERRGQTGYDDEPAAAATTMSSEERSHARLLGEVTREGIGGQGIAKLEGRHRSIGGNALRAAVLGANDGLVSNLALVLGVAGAAAGAGLGDESIVLAGLAGLLAGAFSMAMGEWISVRSSVEAAERQLAIEADELEAHPEEEAEELRLIYMAKGLPEEQARAVAERLMQDHDAALDVKAREELGIDPDDLGGSPTVAAGTSFVLFALGAVVPLLPFLLGSGTAAIVASVGASAAGLFGLGAATTLFTGLPPGRAGVRQAALGVAAALLTYGVGRLLGVSVG